MVLSCWQGEPPMIRSMAPGSILARRVCSSAPPSLNRCQTLLQARSKKGLPSDWRLAQRAS
eukprot:1131536-Heterocapsa_arctica.AAC.1